MISTSFRIKKPRQDRQNHQNCVKTVNLNENPKHFETNAKLNRRLKKSNPCTNAKSQFWLKTIAAVHGNKSMQNDMCMLFQSIGRSENNIELVRTPIVKRLNH